MHHNSEPDQTTRLDERRESINLPPRREDGTQTQPAASPAPAAAAAAAALALMDECVCRRRGARRAPSTATQYSQYACSIAGSLRSCCSTVDIRHLLDALVAPCDHRGVELGRARAVQRVRKGRASDSFISSHRCSLSNLCVDERDQPVHHARKLSSSLDVHEARRSCWWLISAPQGMRRTCLYHHLDLALASQNVFCGNKVE